MEEKLVERRLHLASSSVIKIDFNSPVPERSLLDPLRRRGWLIHCLRSSSLSARTIYNAPPPPYPPSLNPLLGHKTASGPRARYSWGMGWMGVGWGGALKLYLLLFPLQLLDLCRKLWIRRVLQRQENNVLLFTPHRTFTCLRVVFKDLHITYYACVNITFCIFTPPPPPLLSLFPVNTKGRAVLSIDGHHRWKQPREEN